MQILEGNFNSESPPPISATHSLSKKIFQIQWTDHFPLRLHQSEIDVVVGDYATVSKFVKESYHRIYGPSSEKFFDNPLMGAQKNRYYEEAGDFFLFLHEKKVVGFFVGTLIDWSSYYFRNCSILPEYQGEKIYQKFLAIVIDIIQKTKKVDRLEGDVSPVNYPHIHILNKFQFTITGFNSSERWGTLLHFTKFLNPEIQRQFSEIFCHGISPKPIQDG